MTPPNELVELLARNGHYAERQQDETISAWDDVTDLSRYGGHLSDEQMEYWRDIWRRQAIEFAATPEARRLIAAYRATIDRECLERAAKVCDVLGDTIRTNGQTGAWACGSVLRQLAAKAGGR